MAPVSGNARHRGLAVFLAIAIVVGAVMAVMAEVGTFAPDSNRDSYEITSVDMDVTVRPDGSVAVHEERTYDFDGSFNGVYWTLSKEGRADSSERQTVEVLSASCTPAGGETAQFELADSASNGDQGVYTVDDESSYSTTEVKLYWPVEDSQATFAIDYVICGPCARWEDVGDVWWKFVSDDWDVDSNDVTCTVHLPVPEGQSVAAGDNVRAWGHGDLAGDVSFSDSGDVVFTIPKVESGDYAEMRIVMPESWLGGMETRPEEQLPSIMEQEAQWAEEANQERKDAAALTRDVVVGFVVLVALIILAPVLIAVERRSYRREHTPAFQDDYFRDVPTDDEPAVLALLYEKDSGDKRLVSATVLSMIDRGICTLRKVTPKEEPEKRRSILAALSKLGEPDTDWLLTQEAPSDRPVEEKTLELVFGVDQSTWMVEGEGFAKHSMLFSQMAYTDYDRRAAWRRFIEEAYESRFLAQQKPRQRTVLKALRVLYLVLTFLLPIASSYSLVARSLMLGNAWLMMGSALLVLGSFVALPICGNAFRKEAGEMVAYTPEGVEVKAKLDALRRWLLDFTNLDEAIPADVVLWNRLLVLATALGVAEEVAKQLAAILPEVVDDPDFETSRIWFYGSADATAAAVAATDSLSSFASAFDSFSSSFSPSYSSGGGSDSDGGGGGFSDGGGGGSGGGGGGGAF